MNKITQASVTRNLVPVIEGAVGYVSSKLVNKIPSVAANPNLSAGVKLGAGLIIAAMGKGTAQNFGTGMAIAGATDFATNIGIAGNRRRRIGSARNLAIGCPPNDHRTLVA